MIEILQVDITTLQVDAIVNAANHSLLGGGGVDGAIHRAAGPELKQYNQTLGGCPTGEARFSPGFMLPAKYVISTVGPVWYGGERGEAMLLDSAYRSSFILALQHDIKSIAFPAISTGVYAYPKEMAARTALMVMKEYEEKFERITAACHAKQDVEIYESVLAKLS